ncbi:hypothetical protein BH10ACT7_BH10ACT7_13910 [soil metagenome]
MRARRASELTIGGEPRVDLLPPEMRRARKDAAIRAGMLVLLGALVIAVVAGTFGTSLLAAAAEAELAAEQEKTTELFAQQQEFIEVRQNAQQIAQIEAAVRVGTSTLVDWETLLASLTAAFPEGTAVRSFTLQSATPLVGQPQATTPLAQAGIATVAFEVYTPTLLESEVWIRSLVPIEGVADVDADSVRSAEGGYLTRLTVWVDETVLMDGISE